MRHMRLFAALSVGLLGVALPARAAIYSDDFESYAPGGLGGQDGWVGHHQNPPGTGAIVPSGTSGRIDVVSGGGVSGSQGLQITGKGLVDGNFQAIKNIAAVTPDSGGLITVTFDVKGGILNDSRTMWAVYF